MNKLLLTGFEPFGGDGAKPSAEVARALNGEIIGNARIVGEVLPVDATLGAPTP